MKKRFLLSAIAMVAFSHVATANTQTPVVSIVAESVSLEQSVSDSSVTSPVDEGQDVATDHGCSTLDVKDAQAQYERANQYYDGEGVPVDYEVAKIWYLCAAMQGHSSSQAMLGIMFAYGEGTDVNKKQAAYWYDKAAAQGHRGAQALLGRAYLNGDGVEQDKNKARHLLKSACAFGHQSSCQVVNELDN